MLMNKVINKGLEKQNTSNDKNFNKRMTFFRFKKTKVG